MRLFLSGPMGSGKSTLARAYARRTGARCWDLDHEIEHVAGESVSELFAERGEAAFRALEAEVLRSLLAQPSGVIALGGGTVTQPALRAELLRSGCLITLEADADELARRVGGGEGRPLLAGRDVSARIRELLAARSAHYAECHARITTAGRSVDSIVDELVQVTAEQPIVVPLGERTYRAHVSRGARAQLASHVRGIAPSGNVLLVSDETVMPLWGASAAASLRAAGFTVFELAIAAGEQNKTIDTVRLIWDRALDAQLDRGSALVGVGGGVVGDLTGFAASTLLRGVAVGHVPTTLLAMVDSAIGGKTGFDTRQGKNLVGTFHQPSFVLCDPEVLSTLPLRELRAGLAEVVKSAWIEGEAAVARLEADAAKLIARDFDATVDAIHMSAALKAKIVTQDEREGGLRAVLNFGHTIGHAIEAASGYSGLLHGEAVALGMVAAFRLSERMGHAARAQTERLIALLDALGLPTDVDRALAEHPDALNYIGSDKKRRGSHVTFVLPAAPGNVVLRKIALDEVMGPPRGGT